MTVKIDTLNTKDNKVTKNEVYDELHKKSMDAGLCPDMKLSTEDTQIGDII